MIEQQLQDLELSEPPLGFDPDAVVDRIERSTRRRRAVTGSAVAVTTVLAAVVLVPTLRSSEHPQVVSGAGGPTSEDVPHTGPARESDEWEKYLVEHLRTIAPQVSSVTPTTVTPGESTPVFWRNEVVPLVMDAPTTKGSVIAEIAGAATIVHIEAFGRHVSGRVPPVRPDRACSMIIGLNPKNKCELTTLPDGSSLIEVDIADIEIPSPFFRYAEHFRNDGTVVSVANFVNGADNKDRVPLTAAQLRKLATDSAFSAD